MRGIYTDYARAFLLTDQRAHWVVSEAFDILWVCWDTATASDNLHRYAWCLLRSRVMLRAPCHHDGRPDLRAAVFSTREVHNNSTVPGHLVVLTELIDLFDAITRLPEDQMDAAVLHYLCGIPYQAIAHVLGIAPTLTHAVDHHARATVEALLTTPNPE
ncbi:sigma-70 family RNA polymerase sigma factor [Streptomyces pseudogriseolus]|uniref:sigma-70 family RNA polymerase sigma factor n=1 Tax=Streptomyces pseudogriseolus TaxID=36817 RepID=UPI003FA25C0B